MILPRLPLLALCLALLAGCASAPDPAADAIYERGLAQAEGGEVDAAVQTLSGGVRAHPTHWRMRFELARLQFESGEALHVKERQAQLDAADYADSGKRDEAAGARRKANQFHAKAAPFYSSARDNLEAVVDGEDDEHLVAWAYTLLTRVYVFFEDWEPAYESIEKAITLGHPTGPQLAKWREFQSGIKEQFHHNDAPH